MKCHYKLRSSSGEEFSLGMVIIVQCRFLPASMRYQINDWNSVAMSDLHLILIQDLAFFASRTWATRFEIRCVRGRTRLNPCDFSADFCEIVKKKKEKINRRDRVTCRTHGNRNAGKSEFFRSDLLEDSPAPRRAPPVGDGGGQHIAETNGSGGGFAPPL